MKTLILLTLLTSYAFPAAIDYFSDAPRTFKPLLADPREAQMRAGYLYSGDKSSFLDFALGGQLNVLNAVFDNGHVLNIAVKALMASRFQYWSRSFDLQNADYIGGLSTVFGRNTSFVELFLSHQSSHYGDDIIYQNGIVFKNYSFESMRLLYSRDFVFPLRVYAGPWLCFRSDPQELVKKMHLIFGAEYTPDFLSNTYIAMHFNLRQERDWTPDTAFTVGYLLGDAAKTSRRQRIFLEVYNGYSPMGQYSLEREFSLFLGFGFSL